MIWRAISVPSKILSLIQLYFEHDILPMIYDQWYIINMIYYPNIFIQLVFGKMVSTLICTASGSTVIHFWKSDRAPPIFMTRAEKPGHNTWTQLLSYRSLEERTKRTKMHWTLKLWMGQWNPPVDGLSMFIPLYICRVSTMQGGAGFRNHSQ